MSIQSYTLSEQDQFYFYLGEIRINFEKNEYNLLIHNLKKLLI